MGWIWPNGLQSKIPEHATLYHHSCFAHVNNVVLLTAVLMLSDSLKEGKQATNMQNFVNIVHSWGIPTFGTENKTINKTLDNEITCHEFNKIAIRLILL